MIIQLPNLIKFFRYWFPLITYCILIFLQSSFPPIESVPELPYSDKVLHFIAYAILGALFFRAYSSLQVSKHLNALIILSVLSSSLYGISDEIHQYFVPYRNFSYFDILADMLGSLFGVFIYQFIMRKQIVKRFNFLN
ncbi:MAG: VanZ family protein [Thermodesulfobacteriota bacterium]|nr:VanZ family protein [Thermodesulfobacteriota bacterium]